MAEVALDHIGKTYPNGYTAVHDLTLDVLDGEFLVLVGPSGCGKSTALRMVAGLEDITEGELRIDGVRMNEVMARDRDIAMVFQSYALYPHMTVADNIAFGLKLRKVPKEEIRKQVDRAAKMLGLEELLDRRPKELSGGQRQRVAMGRAIVRNPKAFLMDEPLSNLDAKLRVQMRSEIAKLQQDMGVTTIYVTHDQVEAMTMGHRVAVMRKGVLQQVDAPQTLYDHPMNLFVAGFIGSPPMNMVEGRIEVSDGTVWAIVGEERVHVDPANVSARPALRGYDGRSVAVGIRPEDMYDVDEKPDAPADQRLHASVLLTEALGSEVVVHFTVDAPKVETEHAKELAADAGADELVGVLEQEGTPFVARFGPRTRVGAGDRIELFVDTARTHFFDLDTGLSITS
ncbi:MAG TPA: sn-glycerol-3-phosphate ABC transporter ATP-binding protein UgpC [Acidimicrobiales bacterium]|jgi:multiple sugar transport system ATP-binding protein